MRPEWEGRLNNWLATLEREFYEPLGEIALEGFCTFDLLDPADAERQAFAPMPVGTPWGRTWEYCWLRGEIELDERAQGQRIVMDLRAGGEATLFVNGEAFGTRRAEWVQVPHHYICDQILTNDGQIGQRFHLLMEAYAGHDYPERSFNTCATGPVREGDYEPRDAQELRQAIGRSSWGVWHEEAYQLWLDVTTLRDLLSVTDDTTLRAARIEEALEAFTLAVDFEQPREARLRDYVRARELLRPALEARNGSTMPRFAAIGNAHIDVCWLWPYRETQRKVARTFAQQLRLMELYPDYKFIQSQPQTYLICKQLYPKLHERVKEKIRTGQWIADGSMWVEPDTNMTSGESLIRQILHGKRFYREEFGVDCRLLWLPDSFGYSAVLPQILKGCGVEYLTTQKIFWTYNGADRFPYHYFTWQGMDGSEITTFLHMDYTSRSDAATVVGRWRDRVQRRDLSRFLLPFGYGDGGGGPCRDHIEYVLREGDLEGVPQVAFEGPVEFFADCARDGGPANRYVGELYFQCHRGTYTSQAAIKRGNRRSELALREAEIWSVAAQHRRAYPSEALERCWKGVLLNQFHDILPGSSIARVYQEACRLHDEILSDAAKLTDAACRSLTSGTGRTYFNSLSWPRRLLARTERGYGRVTIPPFGWTSRVDEGLPDVPVTAEMGDGEVVLGNGLLCVRINARGELIECRDAQGHSRISGRANVLKLYKDVPRLFDAWDIDSNYVCSPIPLEDAGSISIVEATPWRAVVEVVRRVDASDWTQRISLEAGRMQIDFETQVDWHEKHRLLKVAFPTGVHADEAINEIQFGYIRRPTHHSRPYDADRFEVCNHRYTALCDENRGAAVLNDCKYGVSMLGDEIALTLLRASTSPDLHADQGQHRFTYSYYLWDGPFAACDVVRAGYELNLPVTEAEGCAEEFSLLSVDAPNVIVETVKAAEDGSGDAIIRLYESKHAACDAVLTLNMPAALVWDCDLLENPTVELPHCDGRVALSFHGFGIKTLRVRRA